MDKPTNRDYAGRAMQMADEFHSSQVRYPAIYKEYMEELFAEQEKQVRADEREGCA